MIGATSTTTRLAVFIPLSSSARTLIRQTCHLAPLLDAKPRFYFAGEDHRALRDAIASMFPDGQAPGADDLVIEDLSPAELVRTHSRASDCIVPGFVLDSDGEARLSTAFLRRIVSEGPCSFLLSRGEPAGYNRGGRVVCAVRYGDESQSLLGKAHAFYRRSGADTFSIVHEVSPDRRLPGDPADALNDERAMLRSFVEPVVAVEGDVTLDCVMGEEGSGIFAWTNLDEACMLFMPAPQAGADFWEHLFDPSTDPWMGRLNCPLYLYRESPARHGTTED